jgi:hypothetical protein
MTPTNPLLRRGIRNSTNRSYDSWSSKEHEHTKVEFCGIVIPNGNGKKFPKYRFQPTWEIAFHHSKIKEQVQHAPRKKVAKKISLCTQTGKTHTSHRSQPLSGKADTIKGKVETKPRRMPT